MPEPTPLEAIFFAALEKSVGERAAWLNEACAGDTPKDSRTVEVITP